MKPVPTSNTTTVLGAPRDWDASRYGPCEGLPVTKSDGVFYSWWKPSLRERLALLFGCNVRLCLTGVSHPPVILDTQP